MKKAKAEPSTILQTMLLTPRETENYTPVQNRPTDNQQGDDYV
jgi:hypothetical protein